MWEGGRIYRWLSNSIRIRQEKLTPLVARFQILSFTKPLAETLFSGM
jgi:hypothetical protein